MSAYSHVVGLDLSLTSTGLAVINPDGSVTTDRIQSKGTRADTLTDRRDRLGRIVTHINHQIPWDALVIVEGPAFSRTTGHQHDRSGLWWLVVTALTDSARTVVEVGPSCRARYGAGKGNAAKDAVLAAAVKRYPAVDITGNDIADAVILAAMGRRWLGQPIDNMPQTHLTAMAAVAWPVADSWSGNTDPNDPTRGSFPTPHPVRPGKSRSRRPVHDVPVPELTP